MDPIRTLAQAAGAWLQYEFACGRAMLFNERYLSTPIANALYATHHREVRAEFLHPILAEAKTGPGRRPEVDFAVIDNYPNAICVVESKWVGPNGLSAEDILWDLLRLELAAYHARASAFFILAGRRRHLERFFTSRAFLGAKAKDGSYRRLLKLDERRNARIRVDTPPPDRRTVLTKLLQPYGNISFPSRITTSICHSYPTNSPMFQYQAYAWRVITPHGTPRFFPKNHSVYGNGSGQ